MMPYGFYPFGRRPVIARPPPPTERPDTADGQWIPPGRECVVAGRRIPGGMVYLGRYLEDCGGGWGIEPALIDPDLEVSSENSVRCRYLADQMGYEDFPPECRGAYLDWLAAGRRDPEIFNGALRLFIYGLERRLLVDLAPLDRDASRAEAELLIAELESLIKTYSDRIIFPSATDTLVLVARGIWCPESLVDTEPPLTYLSKNRIPLGIRVAVGAVIRDQRPIPVSWALAWAWSLMRRRNPKFYGGPEVDELFKLRYRQRFGDGMVQPRIRKRLKLEYRPLSPSFKGELKLPSDLPDLRPLRKGPRLLREMLGKAREEIQPYLDSLEGDSGDRSLRSLAWLPRDLFLQHSNRQVCELRDWFEKRVGDAEYVVIEAGEMLEALGKPRGSRVYRRDMRPFRNALRHFGRGIEPDVELDGLSDLNPSTPMVLFRSDEEPPEQLSESYRAATALLHLGAMVVSQGGVTEADELRLERHLERGFEIEDAERRRLRAHLHLLLSRPPSHLRGFRKRLGRIAADKRRRFAELLTWLAADGEWMDPGEIEMIKKIYRLLDRDPRQVLTDLHAVKSGDAAPGASEPVVVREGSPEDPGYAIPAQDTTGGLRLDRARVERTLAETAEVSRVLGEIFVDAEDGLAKEDGPGTQAEPGAEAGHESIAGLDAAHSALVQALAGRQEIPLAELEELAEGLGLLAGGAIETINEAAFDAVDAPLFEGEDPVEIDGEVLAEMPGA